MKTNNKFYPILWDIIKKADMSLQTKLDKTLLWHFTTYRESFYSHIPLDCDWFCAFPNPRVQNVYFPFNKIVICCSDNCYESALMMHFAFWWIKLLDDASLIKSLVLVKPQSNFALLPSQLIFIPISKLISSNVIRGGLYFRYSALAVAILCRKLC